MKLIIPSISLILLTNCSLPIISYSLSTMIILVILNFPISSLSSYSLLTMMDPLSSIMMLLSLTSVLLIMFSTSNLKKISKMTIFILMSLIPLFLMSNMIHFYVLFELVLIPTMILITSTGKQPERLKAAIYLIMYTVTGSLPLLLVILFIPLFPDFMSLLLSHHKINFSLIMIMAFLIKLPMFFTHLWLPKAHVEAPLEGSMILAAVLLKLGGYGIIRFLPYIYFSMKNMSLWLISVSLIGALTTSMNCFRQKDLKALIALSSVSHMGLVLASLMTMNSMGLAGAIIMMIGHGFSSSALFFLVTILYSNYHTRNISAFKGVISLFPNFTFWLFIFLAVNISAPPTINIISEMLILGSLILWNTYSMYMLFLIALATASFSIMLYINLSHNMSEMKHSINPPQKAFISLMSHIYPLIIFIMKLDLMT